MRHKYNIANLMLSALAYKGAIYPGIFSGRLNKNVRVQTGTDYENIPVAPALERYTSGGAPMRTEDHLGRLYFMPVYIGVDGATIEIPHAVISFTSKKTIVETPLVGRNGSVKELISTDDYEISITGVIESKDRRNYPEVEVKQLQQLYERNEAVELICALGDLLLGDRVQEDQRSGGNTMIVLKSCRFPAVEAVEYAQVIELAAVSDQSFELEIE